MKKKLWITFQPCAVCGGFSEYHEGVGRNHASHVRRASNSGTACKPGDEFLIPACARCHDYQHRFSEAEALFKIKGDLHTMQSAKDWYDEQARFYDDEWKNLYYTWWPHD